MGNPFLQGNLGPVREEHTATELKVTGAIPSHLDGRYLRNGPNPASEIDPETYMWFMGDAMVHGVRVRDGKALWYRNRWVRTPEVSRALGEKPLKLNPRAGMLSVGANTHVIGHGGKTLALIEGGMANFELTEELETVGTCDFDGTLPGGFSAHPLRDPATGELHAVTYFFGWGNRVRYSVIGADGRARKVVDIEVTGSPMMHSFALTEKYVVIFDFPVRFNNQQAATMTMPRPLRLPAQLVLSSLVGKVRVPDPVSAALGTLLPGNNLMPYRWDNKYPARIGLLPREGGADDVRWVDMAACYVFHPVNAYDDGGNVVLDVVRHEKVFHQNRRDPVEGTPTLDRWTIDVAAGTLREDRFDDRSQEFPRVDERLVGRKHRYGYAPAFDLNAANPAARSLLKHDFEKGSTQSRSFGKGTEVGEFVFEPNTPDSAEDDGVLMGLVYDAATDRSDLTFLDAGTLETVAQVHLPARVPHGFHGSWASAC